MQQSPDVLPFAPTRFPRGVHSYVEQPSGDTVYCAITATGALLNGELRRRLVDETEPFLVRDLWRDLRRQDPVIGRPRLFLVGAGVRTRRPA
jgi:hypothetical protein